MTSVFDAYYLIIKSSQYTNVKDDKYANVVSDDISTHISHITPCLISQNFFVGEVSASIIWVDMSLRFVRIIASDN